MPPEAEKIELIEKDGGVLLRVKVVPGASRSRVLGVWSGGLRLAVAAPPEKGRANEEVIALLAETLGIPKRSVTIAAGATSPRKAVWIAGMKCDHCRRLLAACLS